MQVMLGFPLLTNVLYFLTIFINTSFLTDFANISSTMKNINERFAAHRDIVVLKLHCQNGIISQVKMAKGSSDSQTVNGHAAQSSVCFPEGTVKGF